MRQERNVVVTSTNLPFSDPAKKEDWFDYKNPYFRKVENKFRINELSLINLQSFDQLLAQLFLGRHI